MNKSLLVASFAVLTVSVFGMDNKPIDNSNNLGKRKYAEIKPKNSETISSNQNAKASSSQNLSGVLAIPSQNALKNAYPHLFKMDEEEKVKQIINLMDQVILLQNAEKTRIGITDVLNRQLRESRGLAESSRQALEREKENLESLLRDKVDEIDNLKDKIEKEKIAKKINAEKVEELNKQLEKIQVEKEELESSLRDKNEKIEELTEQHEKDFLSRRLNAEKNEELTEQLNNLQNEKEKLEKQLEESRNGEAELTEKIERLNQKIEQSREKRQKIREEKNSKINELMRQVANLEQQLGQKNNEVDELIKQISDLKKRSEQIEIESSSDEEPLYQKRKREKNQKANNGILSAKAADLRL